MSQPGKSLAPDSRLAQARHLAATGRKEEAHSLYIQILAQDPSNLAVLHEFGCLAYADGFSSAAHTIYSRIVQLSPCDAVARTNLGSLLLEKGELADAKTQFETALRLVPASHDAHRGLARVLGALEQQEACDRHWRKSFDGQAIATQPYRGAGAAIPVLLLVSAKGGNIPVRSFLDDRVFSVTTLYVEYYRADLALPDCPVVFNAIGDAELCPVALDVAARIADRTKTPIINPPARVRRTDRVANASRLSKIPGVRSPMARLLRRPQIEASDFPLLLRSPGFHAGQNFMKADDRKGLHEALEVLPGDNLLSIAYIDTRGPDGFFRKYRVMSLGGRLFPIHLAISRDWKVHYFTSEMASNATFRAEEERFLADMALVLGAPAVAALERVGAALGLDYAGIDFTIDRDGSVLVFEANATMVINPPPPEAIWDYRRPAIASALRAATGLVRDRAAASHSTAA